MQLFRSMKEAADGLPTVGASGRTLGVRPATALMPDVPLHCRKKFYCRGKAACRRLPTIRVHCLLTGVRENSEGLDPTPFGSSNRTIWNRISYSASTGPIMD
jgi:hypothetical protein